LNFLSSNLCRIFTGRAESTDEKMYLLAQRLGENLTLRAAETFGV